MAEVGVRLAGLLDKTLALNASLLDAVHLRPLIGGIILMSCVWIIWGYLRSITQTGSKIKSQSDTSKTPVIKPLENFDWEKTEPLQFRPFQGKPKYNLTMGMSYTSSWTFGFADY